MEFKFDAATFEMVQNLVFPLVKSLAGFDVEAFVGDKSQMFKEASEALDEVSALFMLVGTALEDGRLSADEVEAIVLKAKTIPEAVDELLNLFGSEEDAPE